MLKAAQDAVSFCQGQTVGTLRADRTRALAAIRCLEIVCDAAEKMTPDFKKANQNIPWRIIAHMRKRMSQLYFSIDLSVILETTEHELPHLITDLTAAIVAEEKEDAAATEARESA